MNPLLFMYLNLVRGPQIMRAKQEKLDEAARKQQEADIASGKLPKLAACKKCDAPVDRRSFPVNGTPTCDACRAKEAEELRLAQIEAAKEMKMSPFLWFQLFVMCLGLTVFFHRNVMPLF